MVAGVHLELFEYSYHNDTAYKKEEVSQSSILATVRGQTVYFSILYFTKVCKS